MIVSSPRHEASNTLLQHKSFTLALDQTFLYDTETGVISRVDPPIHSDKSHNRIPESAPPVAYEMNYLKYTNLTTHHNRERIIKGKGPQVAAGFRVPSG